MKNYQTIIVFLVVIFIILILPYLLWKDKVEFAPEIFLTEWYKTIFIIGGLGLTYRFLFERKITHLINLLRTKSDFNTINQKLNQIERNLNTDSELTNQVVQTIVNILQTSELIKKESTLLVEILDLQKKIRKYYAAIEGKSKNEMGRIIIFHIKKIKTLTNR